MGVVLGSSALTLDQLVELSEAQAPVEIAAEASAGVERARAVVEHYLEQRIPAYGLTTNLGNGRDVPLDEDELATFQSDLVGYHAATIGERLPSSEVRAMMLARLNGFTRGRSGISPDVLATYVEFVNRGITPVVRRFGSVGAADLAPLAAVARAIGGEGLVEYHGEIHRAQSLLPELGVAPARLTGKDGLALISANAYSIGVGAIALHEFVQGVDLAERAFVLGLEATDGNLSWLAEVCSAARPFSGQLRSAARVRRLLTQSTLNDAARAASMQDTLAVRSFTHLGGATLEYADLLAGHLELELNSSGDNPLVDDVAGVLVSTANFNVFEIALGFESLKIAVAQTVIGAERRVQRLARLRHDLAPDEAGLGLPAQFTFGFAGLAARARALAHPVTLDVPPLAGGQEDLASGAPLAIDAFRELLRLQSYLSRGELALAVDLLVARRIPPPPALADLFDQVCALLGGDGRPDELGGALEALAEISLCPLGIRSLLDLPV